MMENPPSPRYIRGSYSGNTGSHNTMGSNNTIHFHTNQDRNPSENYEKILQQLYPPGSGYLSHRNRVPKPVKGTCTWVTGHPKYKEWFENKTSGHLWLSADPGCGKSVIAAFLVGNLETQTEAIVCYYFFKDDSEEQRSTTFALRAILHQLFTQRPNLYSYAEGAFKTKGSRFTEEVDTLWDILVKATAEGGCGDVICVLDALDECNEGTITPLIDHITRLRERQPSGIPLKFFVTSRPYHRIEVKLGSPTMTIRLKGEEEVPAITADVNRVIDEGVGRLESHWGPAGGLGYLRDLLKLSADRTFLWVSLILEILKACQDDSPEEFSNIVATTPRDLAHFYTRILDKSPDPVKARRILSIVVAAARPLTLREMHIAFRIKREHTTMKDLGDFASTFEKTVKNLCGLFVRVIDEKIYLVHQTAREFLIKGSSTGQGNWQYTLCSRHANFVMADICISYLSLEDFGNDPLPWSTSDSLYGLSRGEIDHVREHVLLDYAANHWPDHFRDSQERQRELFELTRPICERGSNRFLTWFKVFWANNRGFEYAYDPFPNDFTHLMIASWLGQEEAVGRILEEAGDLNEKSKAYGTALNVAALRGHENIAKALMARNVIAYILGKEVNILKTKSGELDGLRFFFLFRELFLFFFEREKRVLDFLKPFCIQDTHDPDTFLSRA